MPIDKLNHQVTAAILRAESFPDGSRDGRAAFRDVAALEEAIAVQTAPDDIEGEIARVGAVTASLRAGEPLRAVALATRFLSEHVEEPIAERLKHLQACAALWVTRQQGVAP